LAHATATQNGGLHSMGISWEQELRDTVNRNNNDLVEDPAVADALPVRVDIARPVTGIDVEVTATPET